MTANKEQKPIFDNLLQQKVYFKFDENDVNYTKPEIQEILLSPKTAPYFTIEDSKVILAKLRALPESKQKQLGKKIYTELYLNGGLLNTIESEPDLSFAFDFSKQNNDDYGLYDSIVASINQEKHQDILRSVKQEIEAQLREPIPTVTKVKQTDTVRTDTVHNDNKEAQTKLESKPEQNKQTIGKGKNKTQDEKKEPDNSEPDEQAEAKTNEEDMDFQVGDVAAEQEEQTANLPAQYHLEMPRIMADFEYYQKNDQNKQPGPLDEGFTQFLVRQQNERINNQLRANYQKLASYGRSYAQERLNRYEKLLAQKKEELDQQYLDPDTLKDKLDSKYQEELSQADKQRTEKTENIDKQRQDSLANAKKEYEQQVNEIKKQYEDQEARELTELNEKLDGNRKQTVHGVYEAYQEMAQENTDQELSQYRDKLAKQLQDDVDQINEKNNDLASEIYAAYQADQQQARKEAMQEAREEVEIAAKQAEGQQFAAAARPKPQPQPQVTRYTSETQPQQQQPQTQSQPDSQTPKSDESKSNDSNRSFSQKFQEWLEKFNNLDKRIKYGSIAAIVVIVAGSGLFVGLHKESYADDIQEGKYEQAADDYPDKRVAIEQHLYKGVTKGDSDAAKQLVAFNKKYPTTYGKFDSAVLAQDWKKAYQIYDKNQKSINKLDNRQSIVGYVLLKNGYYSEANKIAKKANDSTLNKVMDKYQELAKQRQDLTGQKSNAQKEIQSANDTKNKENQKKKDKDQKKIDNANKTIEDQQKTVDSTNKQLDQIDDQMSKI